MSVMLWSLLPLAALALYGAIFPQGRAKRVEQRMRAGDDRYLDEQQSYHAYPMLRDPKRIRLASLGTLIAIAVAIGADFLR